MTKMIDLSDPSKVSVVRKDDASKTLDAAQVEAIKALVAAQGDIASLSPGHKASLKLLQAKYVSDPGIVGSAVVADFSLRVVSIHKTWGFFKNFSSAPDFDPAEISKPNLTLEKLVKKPGLGIGSGPKKP